MLLCNSLSEAFNVPQVLFIEEVFYGSSHYLSIVPHESGNISYRNRNTFNDVYVLHNLIR